MIPSDLNKYYEFYTMIGLNQLIKVPPDATCNSSNIEHILASFHD